MTSSGVARPITIVPLDRRRVSTGSRVDPELSGSAGLHESDSPVSNPRSKGANRGSHKMRNELVRRSLRDQQAKEPIAPSPAKQGNAIKDKKN